MKSYKIEEEFEYKGYNCLIVGLSMGHRCGYVVLPQDHKYHEFSYHDMYDVCDIDVHGGLTYDGYGIVEKYKDNWVLGFDCAHCGDGKDFDLIEELASLEFLERRIEDERMFGSDGEVRSKEYVKN